MENIKEYTLAEAFAELNRLTENNHQVTLTAYHGSSKKFNKFDVSKVNTGHNDGGMYGPGLYFTESPELAKMWNDSGYLYKVRLTFLNPYVCRTDEDRDNLSELLHGTYANGRNATDMTSFKKAGYDSVISYDEIWESDTDSAKHNQYVAFKNDQIEILEVEEY